MPGHKSAFLKAGSRILLVKACLKKKKKLENKEPICGAQIFLWGKWAEDESALTVKQGTCTFFFSRYDPPRKLKRDQGPK